MKTPCAKQLHGFMPPCVLEVGHAGSCQDGFGGHYEHGEPQTDADLSADLAREKQRADIKERAERPLVGTAGEYGTGDFLDKTAGQMSLFNFTA